MCVMYQILAVLNRGGCYGIWDLGFEGLKNLGFGIWGVKLFGIWDLGKIFGIWDLRLINLNICLKSIYC